jgi:hypothetical protein
VSVEEGLSPLLVVQERDDLLIDLLIELVDADINATTRARDRGALLADIH